MQYRMTKLLCVSKACTGTFTSMDSSIQKRLTTLTSPWRGMKLCQCELKRNVSANRCCCGPDVNAPPSDTEYLQLLEVKQSRAIDTLFSEVKVVMVTDSICMCTNRISKAACCSRVLFYPYICGVETISSIRERYQ